jgi:membrane protease YdiL (CAAX protease family)
MAVVRLICWIWVSICCGALCLHLANPSPPTDAATAEEVAPTEQNRDAEKEAAADSGWNLFSLSVNVFFLHGVTLILIFHLVRQHQTTWREAFGIGSPGFGKAALMATGIVVVAVPLTLFFAVASAQVMEALNAQPKTQQAVQMAEAAAPGFNRFALGAIAILIAPLVEELLFRGVFYPTIKQSGYPRLAVYGTSLLFALSHGNAMTFLPLALLSLALIWLYEKTNNLLAPILAHSLFNAANFVMIILKVDPRVWLKNFPHG